MAEELRVEREAVAQLGQPGSLPSADVAAGLVGELLQHFSDSGALSSSPQLLQRVVKRCADQGELFLLTSPLPRHSSALILAGVHLHAIVACDSASMVAILCKPRAWSQHECLILGHNCMHCAILWASDLQTTRLPSALQSLAFLLLSSQRRSSNTHVVVWQATGACCAHWQSSGRWRHLSAAPTWCPPWQPAASTICSHVPSARCSSLALHLPCISSLSICYATSCPPT